MTTLSKFRGKGALVLAGLFAMVFALVATPAAAQGYLPLNLDSSTPGQAIRTDPNLVVGWGIASSSGSPWWVSNFGSGTSTLYDGFGKPIPLVVTIPPAAGANGTGSPTGIVFNGTTSDFTVSQGGVSGRAFFIFATFDGTISGWSPAVSFTNAIIGLDNSSHGAIYTGLAIGSNANGDFLFAANYGTGTVDVIDKTFTHVRSFTDPGVPAGFAPFGIHNINGNLYVTFAPQQFHLVSGFGFVDVFDTTGALLKRLVTGGPLFGAWGLALAPADFGVFSNMLLVGNLGNGHINAFDPNTGAFFGPLTDRFGNTLAIEGLWGIGFGNDHASGKANVLYYATGLGVFGALYPRGVQLQ
jgi:uncharacterized protein (TIGR03118 family)